MASGLTLVFGVMRVINVAQGALVILSAYLSYVLFKDLHVDPFLSVLIVAPFMFALGTTVQLVFIRSLRGERAEELSLLITWARALGIEGILGAIFQTTYRATNPGYANASWSLLGYEISVVRVYAFVLSVGILALLYLLLAKTRFGRSVRATVQNPSSARLLGVDADRVRTIAFGVGVATAAAGGGGHAGLLPLHPRSHHDLIPPRPPLVALGGVGRVRGAVAAALVLGVVEAVVAVEISPVWSSFSYFVLLIAILLVRPQGLFGVRERTL